MPAAAAVWMHTTQIIWHGTPVMMFQALLFCAALQGMGYDLGPLPGFISKYLQTSIPQPEAEPK